MFIILSLALLSWASLRASAAWNYFAAQSITNNMYEARAFTPAGIGNATSRLEKALWCFPNNPDYLDLRGHLAELEASQAGMVGLEEEQLLESAAADYRASLAVRPLWPYGWSNLLSVKDKLGQVDSEFRTAMNRAAETGPWEPRVQLQIIGSGIRHWDRLGSGQRDLIKRVSADGLKTRPREVFGLVRSFGRPDLVCYAGVEQDQITRWCDNVLSAR